ncbi:ATP-binding cassette domain-containing protein [Niallia sp.]|uniref:ABC transporter ATP-binding protein n=1 Tax=Niallia sp. TaxID=2837523 RepID=UPI002899AE1B|nr:ATP-binding cassette domain-containing protein [Niallia sp.]
MQTTEKRTILSVKGLKQFFKTGRNQLVKAVNGISFDIKQGETYGLVGESGSGKSTTGRSIIRLYNPTEGNIIFDGVSIGGKMSKDDEKHLRTNMQMIFQDPMASLNPRRKIYDSIEMGLIVHKICSSSNERKARVYSILNKVGLSEEYADRYPHELSGGQRQRVGIARALVMNPELVIADEAISALDVSIQSQIVNLMKDIQSELGTTYLFIAHDLSMVRYISDKIGVMHRGYLVETGTTEDIFQHAIHPYTKSLLSAIPVIDPIIEKNRASLEYDYETNEIDYEKGTFQKITESHYVLATSKELKEWTLR